MKAAVSSVILILIASSPIQAGETKSEQRYVEILEQRQQTMSKLFEPVLTAYEDSLKALLNASKQGSDQKVADRARSALSAAAFDREILVLRDLLLLTKWESRDSVDKYIFEADGRYRSPNHAPIFVITGRRSLTMIWAPETNVPCVLNEECTVMTERAGGKLVWKRAR